MAHKVHYIYVKDTQNLAPRVKGRRRKKMEQIQVKIKRDKGWRDWIELTDKCCTENSLKRGSIFNPSDPYRVIYEPCRGGGYNNSGKRAE